MPAGRFHGLGDQRHVLSANKEFFEYCLTFSAVNSELINIG